MSASGPIPKLVSAASKSRLQKLVSSALRDGAERLNTSGDTADGDREEAERPPNSAFPPAIIGKVQANMELWQEEAFGPVVCYVVAQTEDTAIELANASEYGLTAAVFTRDLRKGLAVAKKLEAG